MRIRLLGSIGMTLWAAVVASGQAPAVGLPPDLRARVQDALFDAVSSIRG